MKSLRISFLTLILCCCTQLVPLSNASQKLPVLYKLPQYKLVDQKGKTFLSKNYQDKVYLVSFFFTSCNTSCPIIMSALSRVQGRLEKISKDLKMVSISVDPETDTPKRMRIRGKDYGVHYDTWKMLTGPETDVVKLVEKDFKMAMNKILDKDAGLIDIVHSNRFLLVDKKGQVRGIYSHTKHAEVEKMIKEMKGLLKE